MRSIKHFLLSVLWGALLTLSMDDDQHSTSSTRTAHSPPLREASHRNAGSIDDLQLDASEFFSGSKQRPKLEILAPDNGQVLEKPSVDIQLEVQGYEFPSLLHDSRVCLGLASHGERIMEQCFDQVSICLQRRRRRRRRRCKVSFCFIYFLALRHGLPLPLLPALKANTALTLCYPSLVLFLSLSKRCTSMRQISCRAVRTFCASSYSNAHMPLP